LSNRGNRRRHGPGLDSALLNRILTEIDEGFPDGSRYTDTPAAKNKGAWNVFLKHAPNKTEAQAREVIKTWVRNGVLEAREYHNPTERKDRMGLYVNPEKRPG
jgi:hypothetical protein